MINFVGNQGDPTGLTDLDQRPQFVTANNGSGRIGRARNNHALRRRVQVCDLPRGQLEPLCGPTGQFNRLNVQRAQRVAIGHIAWPGQSHPIAWRKRRSQGQHHGGRRPAGQQDLCRLDPDAVLVKIVSGNSGLQRRAFPIAHGVGVQHLMGPRNRRPWRTGRGLTKLHMQDRPPLGLQPMSQSTETDRIEGVDRGDRQSSRWTRSRRSCRSWASRLSVAIGLASSRAKPMGSPVSSQ